MAVFAAEDITALNVLTICQTLNLRIPEQVAVLGTSDDELVCSLSVPALSSIAANHEKEGALAIRELERLLRRKRQTAITRTICCTDHKTVTRGSTAPVTPAAHIITTAHAFIRENAGRGVTVSDVAHHLGISRRLLDLRFKAFSTSSVHETIMTCRLQRVQELLAGTHLPIGKVARSCRFNNLPYLASLFRKRFGMTMGDWRTAARRSASGRT